MKIIANFAEPILTVLKKFHESFEAIVSLKIPLIIYEPDHNEWS